VPTREPSLYANNTRDLLNNRNLFLLLNYIIVPR